jgi:hypothetical protein
MSDLMSEAASVQLEPCVYLAALELEHRSWLSAFNPQFLRNFEKLRDADYEAAMTEAAVRRFLAEQRIAVEPAEDLTGSIRRPDFLCTAANNKFFVEVTCIGIQKVIDDTALPHPTNDATSHYAPLNNAFWSACQGKVTQCSNLEHPALVAIGTHHHSASELCVDEAKVDMLLTGTTNVSCNIDVRTGRNVGDSYLSTDLYSAAFIRRDSTDGIRFARSSVSGLLLCGFGVLPPKVLGILHPNAVRPFNRLLLPAVSFCELSLSPTSRSLATRWSTRNGK